VTEDEQRRARIAGWCGAADSFLEDQLLSKDEDAALVGLMNRLGLSAGDLAQEETLTRVAHAAILRDVLEGNLPELPPPQQPWPFNLQRSEKLVWVFPHVSYYTEHSSRAYVGGSHGVSLRVMKGVYYRVGAFKANPVVTTETRLTDSGPLGVTTKHLYFHGSSKIFRVPYAKVVSFTPYSDGIGVVRDAQSAKPQTFETGDGWFAYNLVVNLAKLAQP